ncbi:MAG: class I SAM-dependent methyltransferase [Bacillota bacterium]|jgi:tRNA (adenine22-N1)-methyltransferase|nr:class I SAM-dependent methyltransferase [Bacillota bacterium]HHU42740.1 SAM-dependent methyltransferase [Clostridiales bacterium]
MRLDNRLNAILNEIKAQRLADIGADHGKLIVSAVLTGRAETGIAVDISPQSLEKAKNLAKKYNVADRIEFLCSDGLEEVQGADCIVIAGMGANEIIKILSRKRIPDAVYITLPHQDTPYLRKYLFEENFFIKKDYIIKENQRYYSVIIFVEGKSNYSKEELFFGKNTPPSAAFEEYLYHRKEAIDNIISQAGSIDKISSALRAEKKEIERCLIKLKML